MATELLCQPLAVNTALFKLCLYYYVMVICQISGIVYRAMSVVLHHVIGKRSKEMLDYMWTYDILKDERSPNMQLRLLNTVIHSTYMKDMDCVTKTFEVIYLVVRWKKFIVVTKMKRSATWSSTHKHYYSWWSSWSNTVPVRRSHICVFFRCRVRREAKRLFPTTIGRHWKWCWNLFFQGYEKTQSS